MISHFLLNSFLTNSLYLGYSKIFAHAKMSFDIIGHRSGTDIHDLNHTMFSLQKVLKVLESSWLSFGVSWLIAPRNKALKSLAMSYTDFHGERLEEVFTIWYKRWISGFLTNAKAFAALKIRYHFPSNLLYLNYTLGLPRFAEARRANLLQLGIADTNSDRVGYNYVINANEKTASSYLYVARLFLAFAAKHSIKRHKGFISPWVSKIYKV